MSETVASTPSQTRLTSASVAATAPGFVIPVAVYFVAVMMIGLVVGKLLL